MTQYWRHFALLLALPSLSLFAQEAQEFAFDEANHVSQNDHTQRSSCRRKAEKPMPEEEAIRSVPVITPSVAPHVVDGSDTFVNVDFIWWKTYIDGMEYAQTGVSDGGFAVTSSSGTSSGSAQIPNFVFQPGVKVGLGWHFDKHEGWDMCLNWTYLASDSQSSSVNTYAGEGSGMKSVQFINLPTGTATVMDLSSASNKWKQDFNVIDLEMGRDFFLSRYLTMRPFVGFKSAWVHETTTNTLVPVHQTGITSVITHNTEHMWGIGIRTGMNTGWHITKNWLFYGDLALSNLWGSFKNKAQQTLNGGNQTQNTSHSYPSIIPVVEMGVGVGYIGWWCDSRYRFEFRLGWEEQVWLDYNRSQDLYRVGNLTLNGLTLKGQVNF